MKRILIISICLYLASSAFSQFQATMSYTPGNEARIYTVYSDLHQYRYEFMKNGEKGIVIVKPEANQTFILMPAKKFFMKTACDDFSSLMNDPVQASLHFKESQKEKLVGDEQMYGYNCAKKEFYMDYPDPDEDVLVYTVWFSKALNFPVKIENHTRKNNYMLLSDVKNWVPQESYFKIPDGFTEVDEQMRPVIPEPPAPKQWTTKTVQLPFQGKVSRGTLLKFTIDKEAHYKMILENKTDKPVKIIRYSFRDGKELPEKVQGPEKYRTSRLYPGEKVPDTFIWKAGNTILIKSYEGTMYLDIHAE